MGKERCGGGEGGGEERPERKSPSEAMEESWIASRAHKKASPSSTPWNPSAVDVAALHTSPETSHVNFGASLKLPWRNVQGWSPGTLPCNDMFT